jgi:ACS family sodium-dependent inorganic phosphate cotransporter-like MFS transporter 5
VWLALWLAIFADSPHDCKHISSAEQAYLMQLLNRHHPTMKERRSLRTLDWKRILTNMPIYAILLADFGTNFQSTLMHSFLPTYLNDVLYLQLGIIGVLTMLPFVVQIVFKFVWSLLAYFLMHRPAFSQHATFVCKSFHLVSSIGSAMAFIGLGLFVDCKLPTLGIALLIVHGIFFAAIVPGYKTSALCIAPSYNGMIASAMTFSGIIGGEFVFFYLSFSTVIRIYFQLRSVRLSSVKCLTASTTTDRHGVLFFW